MKNIGFIIIAICISNFCFAQEETVTFESLLSEMVDRDQLVKFPGNNYLIKQQSSYERTSISPDDTAGWFANKDMNGFIRKEENKDCLEYVLMEHEGPGVLTRFWMPDKPPSNNKSPNTKRKGTLRIYIDGNEKPVIEGNPFELFDGSGLASYPFCHKSLSSAVSYLPIPWEKSCKITLDREPFYYIFTYRAYKSESKVKSFIIKDLTEHKDLLDFVAKELVKPTEGKGDKNTLQKSIEPNADAILDLPAGTNAIRNLEFSLNQYINPEITRRIIIKIEFDKKETVYCPVGDFFGTGIGIHPFKGWYRTVKSNGIMSCRWIMPYKDSAKVSIINFNDEPISMHLDVTVDKWNWDSRTMYFHCSYKEQNQMRTRPYFDWNYITIHGKGLFVGDALTLYNPVEIWWGEGDAKIWFDHDTFPSMFGTGTEDYYGYAYGGINGKFYEHPFHAQVRVGHYDQNNNNHPNKRDTQGYNTQTRTRALDAIPFNEFLKLDMEVWHWQDVLVDYGVANYWYGFYETESNIIPVTKETIGKIRRDNY